MARESGFSLIEVMVATAIFLVLVTMIGGVFRQATSSWEAGYARAEGGSIIRGVIGTIQRELAAAVDGRAYGQDWNDPVKVSSSSLEFICLKNPPEDESSAREVHRITYGWGGGMMTRKDERLKNSGGAWSVDRTVNTIVYAEDDDSMFSADFKFEAVNEGPDQGFPANIFWTIPVVRIEGTLTRQGSFSGLEVRSHGRNGVPNDDATKSKNDDIISN